MSKFSGQTRSASEPRFRIHLKLFASLALFALLLAAGPARAGEPDEDYLPIYTQIQEADSLATSGQATQALAIYREAVTALQGFQKKYPTWNQRMVSARLNRVVEKISALSEKPAAAPQPRTNVAAGAAPPASERSGTPVGQAKLLEAGAEPRQVLRLHPKAGDKQTLDMTVKVTMENKVGAMETPAMKLPAIKMTLEVAVKSVSAEGDIAYEMVMSDINVADDTGAGAQLAELLKASLDTAKGMSATGTVSDRGVSKAVEVKIPGGIDQQSRQTMEQMKDSFSGAIVMLPEEAVGPGAKWEVRKTNKSQGFVVDQTQTYELVAADGDRLTAKTTVAERAANQKIGGKVDITKYVGTGTGELTYELGHLLPPTASSDSHVDMTMSMGGGAQKQMIIKKTDINVRIQAR